MKDYNGFSADQRNRAQRWLNVQWAAGTLPRPTKCVACGQDEGIIDAHAEDYSEPFRAGVTDGFHLCFACHMMVHCRHRNQLRWSQYRATVEEGFKTLPYHSRNWPRFQREILTGPLRRELFTSVARVERLALYEIELSQDEVAQRLGARHLAVAGR